MVPSYLEVVLSCLEQHPRELPDLRCVSVTGEALKPGLAQRWFAAEPGIKLVNAYGLTETSDDTNHEVMDRAPAGGRVPLGRPVSNVRVYVVGEDLSPVPLGAAGLIAFSGVCVGRGYVNDPERTRQAYRADPHHPGQRLYLGGDYGRWQPDGKLEFLGRRDSQVKISGFRIEIGEIENTLLRVPGVRDGAVVVAGRPGQGQRLVAFYTGPRPLQAGALRDRLGTSLPEYMIPAAFCWRESLPLTANSKIDKKTLTALAGELGDAAAGPDYDAPGTPAERRLAAAWATVLGIPQDQIGRRDNFFDRGGSSLSAVKLAITLDRAVSLKDLTRHPVLADMAALIDGKTEQDGKSEESASRLLTRGGRQPAAQRLPVWKGELLCHTHPWRLCSTWTCSRASPRWCGPRPTALRPTGSPGTVTRCGPWSPSRAVSWSAVWGCVTRPRPVRSSGGWRSGLMTEREAFAPRQPFPGGVYSVTPWPANQQMCMHHELSYALEFPGLVMFACLTAPAGRRGDRGGRRAGRAPRAARRGWSPGSSRRAGCSTRNYNEDIGASVEQAFGTGDRHAVESYCRANAIEFDWQPDGGLRTRQRRSAVVRHPVTGQRCWFNQIAFLNERTIDPEVREYLVEVYGQDGLPFNTFFGNGDPVGADVVDLLNADLRGEHRPRAVAGRRPAAGGQHPHRAQPGTLPGPARGARRAGRPGAPGRLLPRHRGDRPMTQPPARAAPGRSPCRRSR